MLLTSVSLSKTMSGPGTAGAKRQPWSWSTVSWVPAHQPPVANLNRRPAAPGGRSRRESPHRQSIGELQQLSVWYESQYPDLSETSARPGRGWVLNPHLAAEAGLGNAVLQLAEGTGAVCPPLGREWESGKPGARGEAVGSRRAGSCFMGQGNALVSAPGVTPLPSQEKGLSEQVGSGPVDSSPRSYTCYGRPTHLLQAGNSQPASPPRKHLSAWLLTPTMTPRPRPL